MTLDAVRNEIREIDERIIDLVAERQRLAARIARIKQEEGLSIHDPAQRKVVLDRVSALATGRHIDPVAVRQIFEILIGMNEERQREYAGLEKKD